MIDRLLKRAPERVIAIAMALVVTGLSLLTIGIAWPRLSPPLTPAGTDWSDSVRGAIFGFAIALESFGVVIAAKAADQKKRASS